MRTLNRLLLAGLFASVPLAVMAADAGHMAVDAKAAGVATTRAAIMVIAARADIAARTMLAAGAMAARLPPKRLRRMPLRPKVTAKCPCQATNFKVRRYTSEISIIRQWKGPGIRSPALFCR